MNTNEKTKLQNNTRQSKGNRSNKKQFAKQYKAIASLERYGRAYAKWMRSGGKKLARPSSIASASSHTNGSAASD